MRWQSKLTAADPIVIEHLGFYAQSVAVYNMTPYPIYINYSAQTPGPDSYDLLIPAATTLSQRLPGGGEYAAFMDTSGVTVTFTNPPAVITWDSEPDAPSFAQVHLTYPYSSNLQFLARTSRADQYVRSTVLPGFATLLSLVVPTGQLYVVRRAMARVLDATAVNQGYVRVRSIRGVAGFADMINHYYSPVDNGVWVDNHDVTLVCPHVFTPDISVSVRNFGVNPMTVQVRLKIDVVEARLP